MAVEGIVEKVYMVLEEEEEEEEEKEEKEEDKEHRFTIWRL